MKKSLLLCFASALILHAACASDLMLWYTGPAKRAMTEALPIGNGMMGGLVFGGTDTERVVLNESSLWTGEEISTDDYKKMGAYQTVGDLSIELPAHREVSDYRRDLDIGDAVAHVSYKAGPVTYKREYFCSHPDGVMVVRLTADKPGSYSGTVLLKDAHEAQVVAGKNRLTAAGALPNGLKYETQLIVVNEGGSVEAKGQAIELKNCNSVTLCVAIGTDYIFDYQKKYRGEAPHARVTQLVQKAATKSYDALKAGHVKEFQSFFNRVALDLGRSSAEQVAMPTDARKVKAVETFDPQLEELLFQHGRYLLISCSRPGGLPANLQGLWNDSNNPPWHSDYHANINIQMNYWPAEATNLGEFHTPLFDLVRSQLEPWRRATAESKNFNTSSGPTKRGWAVRTSHGIHGDMAWKWDNTANAWYCQHFWEHYAFGGDKEYLRKVAYPVMKEVCQFWEDHLKKLPDGRLVVPNAWSPEHGPTEDGVSYSQEIVWDLFNNYVDACDALGIDKEYRAKVAMMRDQLATPGIGSWGQLLEWMEEKRIRSIPNSTRRRIITGTRRICSRCIRAGKSASQRLRIWQPPRRNRSTRAASMRAATCANGRSHGAPRSTRVCTTARVRTRWCGSCSRTGTRASTCSDFIHPCRSTATSA